jgi:hypothetical protein
MPNSPEWGPNGDMMVSPSLEAACAWITVIVLVIGLFAFISWAKKHG